MKRVLIVVDYQKDFVSGALGFEGAEALEEGICRRIEDYRAAGDGVIFTLDTHGADYLDTEEGRQLPIPHCLKGSDGWQLTDRVAALAGDSRRFEKPTFGSLELARYLEGKAFDEVELCGLVSNICVLSNAVLARAACPNAHIVVDARLTGSADGALQEKCLDVLGGIQVEVLGR